MPSLRSRFCFVLAALTLALPLAACGDVDIVVEQQASAGDVERYCALSKELDRAGSAAFAELEQDPNATEEQFEALERQFVESHQDQLDEIVAVAPEEIRDDVEVLIDAVRGRAGLGQAVPESESGPAEKRVDKFEAKNCKASS